MNYETLSKRLADTFAALSPQLQRAARHVLDKPDDVALMSMRQLAQVADVHPSTMVRLARAVGFDSYTRFRQPFQTRLRVPSSGYLARARDLQARGAVGERSEVLQEMVAANLDNLHATFDANRPEVLLAAARAILQARDVYVVALRGSFSAGFFFYYTYRMVRRNAALLDTRGGTFADDLRSIGKGDLIFAIGTSPYTSETVRAAAYAKKAGATAVVLTDSLVSPLAKHADLLLTVRDQSPSFFNSVVPTIAVVETLVALIVAEGDSSALTAIEQSECQLEEFNAYWRGSDGAHRRPSRPGSRAKP